MPISKPFLDSSVSKQNWASDGGFTLMEMLVVLAIMSLAAVLFASGTGGSSVDQRTETFKLERAITEARAQALQSSTAQAINLENFNAVLEPALGKKSNRLIFHDDGSTNGGIISSGGKTLFAVRWMDGKIEK